MHQGPIVIVDDDLDSHYLFEEALRSAGTINELKFFIDGMSAYHYLKDCTEFPMLIISDITMPMEDGLDFRALLNNTPEIKAKQIPFVLFTSSIDPHIQKQLYETTVQGLFIKDMSFSDFKNKLKLIVTYWANSVPFAHHANS